METIYHQLQGLYTAGDVLCAVDCVRALEEFRHVIFVSHDECFDNRVFRMVTELKAEVRLNALVTEADVTGDLRTVFYHCVGHDDTRRGEYIRFEKEPPGVRLCAWIHTPGLCGAIAERYEYLRGRGCSCVIFDSNFSMQATPGVDVGAFETHAIIHPCVDTQHYATVTRIDDGVFRLGRWNRSDDSKYSDDFVELLSSIEVPGKEVLCMGIPPKLRGRHLPADIRLVENGAMDVEDLLSQLDVLIFKTHAASWHEGWCRTVTEAMAAGVVPVVENRGGIPEQVIHRFNGFLSNTNADFKHWCELLHRDPILRSEISQNARAYAHAHFGLSNLRTDLMQVVAPDKKRDR